MSIRALDGQNTPFTEEDRTRGLFDPASGIQVLNIETTCAEWVRLVWTTAYADDCSLTWLPRIRIKQGVGTGVVTVRADACDGSLSVLCGDMRGCGGKLQVALYVDDPTSTAGAQPSVINLIALVMGDHEQAHATYTTFYEATEGHPVSLPVPRPVGASAAVVTSVAIGAARTDQLNEYAFKAGGPVAISKGLVPGQIVPLTGRTRWLTTTSPGADSAGIIFFLGDL